MLTCPICGYGPYTRQSAVDKHVATVHANVRADGDRPFESETIGDAVKAAERAERKEAFKKPPKGSRLCASGCGFFVIDKIVTYAKGTRSEQKFEVIVHTGFATDQYSQVERCHAS